MARPQKRVVEAPEAFDIPPVPSTAWTLAPSPVRLADGGFEPVDSPARTLQSELAASLAENAQSDRLPVGPVLAFLVIGSAITWAAIIMAVRAIF